MSIKTVERIALILIGPLTFILLVLMVMLIQEHKVHYIKLNSIGLEIYFNLRLAQEKAAVSGPINSSKNNEILNLAKASQDISLSGRKILWVDDNPRNIIGEVQALAALGVATTVVENTEEAINALSGSTQYDAVITDFKRKDDAQGAYTLLDQVKLLARPIPLIIYSASATPALIEEAKNRGAFGETNEPTRLFELIRQALQQS